MDEAKRDLIIRLCTRAGMMMEDASPIAIILPSDDRALAGAIARVVSDVATISRLIETAATLAHPTSD